MANFILPWQFCFHENVRQRFIAGKLGPEWFERYPQLFDRDDLRICRSGCKSGYHFYEWLGAILIYEATGFLSLNQKYGTKSHPRKLPIWEKLAPDNLPDKSGYPDLFVFASDHSDWFFCEVKGARDKLQENQLETFRQIHRATGEPVRVLTLTECRSGGWRR